MVIRMSLQFILGNSGCGKTHRLYQTGIEQSIQNPNQDFLVIVPEQFTMQTQKDFVKLHPRRGVLNIDVLSFGRLAHRVFQELGVEHGQILDDEGKNLILRKLADEFEDQLKVFGKNIKKIGYISEIKSIISEFTQYDVTLEELEAFKEQISKQSMLSYKLEDIYLLYKGFREYLQGRFITDEELPDLLCRVAEQSQVLRNSVIMLDGFTGFTPVQMRLLGKLLTVAQKVYITVTIDDKESIKGQPHPYQMFALSKKMIYDCQKVAVENSIAIDEPIWLSSSPIYRLRDNVPMAFLEEHIFRYHKDSYQEEQENIQMYHGRNPKEESLFVAGEIRRLVRTCGCRYREIAVVAGNLDAYGNYMEDACRAYGIPMFADHKRNILLNSFVEYLRSLLDMVEEKFSYESVFRYLKSGFVEIDLEVRDELENYILATGIRGFNRWSEEWTKTTDAVREERLEVVNSYREGFMERVTPVVKGLSKRKKSVEHIATVLYTHLDESRLEARIREYTEELREEQRFDLEKEYSQIYQIVIELLDKFVALLGEEVVSLQEFSQLFDAGLQEARIGIIPPTMDTLMVGDLKRTRLSEVKYLFFVGVNDTFLPGNLFGGGILSERDREVCASSDLRLKPEAKEQMYTQKFYLYQMLTKPSERLYLTYSKTSAAGKSIRPAYVINEVRKLFPNLRSIEIEDSMLREEVTPYIAFDLLIKKLRDEVSEKEETDIETLRRFQEDPQWNAILESVWKAMEYRGSYAYLTEEVAQELYGKILKNSVSRLEKFASCPYAHFLSYGLKLRERQLHEFQPMDIGNVIHNAVELYGRKVEELGVLWTDVEKSEQKKLSDEIVEACANVYQSGIFENSDRDAYMMQRLKRLSLRTIETLTEQLRCGSFTPSGYEVEFGEDNMAKVLLEGDHEMLLRGKIDRVDTYEGDQDQVYIKVVDYKTGKKEFDPTALYHGLQLQLVIYLDAAMQIEGKRLEQEGREKEIVPAGVFYYRVDDPILKVEGNPEKKDQQEIDKELLYQLTLDGLVNERADVVQALDGVFETKSYAIPVTKKVNGELRAESKAVKQEVLEQFIKYTKNKVVDLGNEIVKGNIEISPYQINGEEGNGCSYCEYGRICGFDTGLEGYEYRRLEKMKKQEAVERIQGRSEDEDGISMDEGTTTGYIGEKL